MAGGIKTTSADTWFSRCVRMRANWTCEDCGTKYGPSDSGLQNSHFHGRGNYSVRFDPLNGFAACTSCHYKQEGNPHEFTQWVRAQIGDGAYDLLLEKKNNIDIGREARRDVAKKGPKLIAEHYRNEYRRMEALREAGETGRIEFVGYF